MNRKELIRYVILFAAGRTEVMKRFLVEEGAGNDARFWRLAQALSALYPASSEEKRWVDEVLARKKGLGFYRGGEIAMIRNDEQLTMAQKAIENLQKILVEARKVHSNAEYRALSEPVLLEIQ